MVEWRQYSRYKRKNKEQIKKDKQKEARFVWGFFLTVQLDNFLITLSECVSPRALGLTLLSEPRVMTRG